MKTRKPSRPPHPFGTSFVLAIIVAAVATACTAGTQAQPSLPADARIDDLRSRIETATSQHAPDAQLGTLWLQLANQYQNRFELSQAEDAFSRSLPLLRSPATQAALADALEGLGLLYSETGRAPESETCLRKSLAIFETLGYQHRIAGLHETLAMSLVFVHRFREGEAESSRAIELLQSQPDPDRRELATALVTHSNALCFQGRCAAALDDANQAMKIAQAVFPSTSPELAAVWLTLGFAQWKSGSLEEGDAAMREAVRIVLSETNLPPLVQLNSQLKVFRQYAAYLKLTHRKPEAAQFEAQIRQLQSQKPATCLNCTISAAALATQSHHP
jgi:tetratricopeptide (TPR) repeat protein